MKLQHLFLILIVCFNAESKDPPKFPVSSIPVELKNNAHAVVREDRSTFKIHSRSKATLTVYLAVTILNPKGKEFASMVLGYDKLTKITNFRGSLYDANGVLVKKLKTSEIYDQSAFDGFSLYSDNRLKAADLSQTTYPYTVEFEYEIEYKFLFIIPSSYVVSQESVSVESYSYSLVYPKEIAPRYKASNINVDPKIEMLNDGKESITWHLKNFEAMKFEPMGPNESELIPYIKSAPTHFEYESYIGKMDTWDEFGQWIAKLNEGRNILSEETIKKVRELTEGINEKEEKVKALYEFMQSKTRYVSIQLGIGGFQPFEAALVEKNGYGDCKALSNYMVSLLEAAGIKSHYTLVRAGGDAPQIDKAFPSSQFNHVIVAVPNEKDTLWLECTSQTNPFGYLGKFTGDRQALLITEDGARVVNTPKYSAEQNLQVRNAEVVLQTNGNASAKVSTIYSGLMYENGNLNHIIHSTADEQKNWIYQNTGIPTFETNSYSIKETRGKIPVVEVGIDLNLNRWATVSGKRIFITPNLMSRSAFIPEKNEQRKTAISRTSAYTLIDTVRYLIPETIYPEHLPEDIYIKSSYGEYQAKFGVDQGILLYTRKLKVEKGDFPPEKYQELHNFFKNINKADNIKVVFLSKT